MKRGKKKTWLLGAAVVTLAGLHYYAIQEPHTIPGYVLFRLSYAMTGDKGVAIRGYQANLDAYQSGLVSKSVDAFLCSRLAATDSTEEFRSIVTFYRSRAYGRLPDGIVSLRPPLKQRVAEEVFRTLDSGTRFDTELSLLLIEALRQGQTLGKTSIVSKSERKRSEDAVLLEAKQRFRAWWKRSPTWEGKASQDPLQGTGVVLSTL